ncbi:MAG: MFS transporter [Proteobacteria bacterium]|nr:MFS transporter [Pseudomonadota bacterium]
MSNPLKFIVDIRKGELPLALLMFGYFFLVITSFWILKPIKKGLFIQFYDVSGFTLMNWHLAASQAELIAKVLNMLVAFAAVVVFTLLVRHMRRHWLTLTFSIFFILGFIYYSQVIDTPGDWTIWSFYLFGDLFSTLMVATFFAFLNDSVTPDKAKRLYGLIGLGGVAGGVFGTSMGAIWIHTLSTSNWLWICVLLALLIIVFSMLAGRLVENDAELKQHAKQTDHPSNSGKKPGNPALEGARLVFASRYLLSIVAIVGIYEIVSTIIDFQFTTTIAHYLDGDAIGQQFTLVFTITNWVSLAVQIFLTSWIMTRFGLKTALMVLPFMIMLGSLAFLALPVLAVGSLLNTVDNGFSYSINQSAKEALYVLTSSEEKYKAKAFIDMFVQRFAKSIAVFVSLGISMTFTTFESIHYLSILVLVLLIAWYFAARYAGNHFATREKLLANNQQPDKMVPE